MRAWGRALVGGLRAVRRTPLVQGVAIGTLAVSLLLLGMVRLVRHNVSRLADGWGRGVQAVVYLDDGAGAARARQIADIIGKLPGVTETRIVEPGQAAERLKRSLGERAHLLDGVEDDLLPASIEVSFAEGLTDALRLAPALERVRKTPGVEDVERMDDWVQRLDAVEKLLTLAGGFLAALVAFACLFIVAATIRLGVFARREEIEILKLVGATDRLVKAPFLVEGAVQGLFGTGLAVALLYACFRGFAPQVEQALGQVLGGAPLAFLPARDLLLAFPAGALLGIVGSSVAVGRYVEV